MKDTVESAFVGDFFDQLICRDQQLGGVPYPAFQNVVPQGHAGRLAEEPPEVDNGETQLGCFLIKIPISAGIIGDPGGQVCQLILFESAVFSGGGTERNIHQELFQSHNCFGVIIDTALPPVPQKLFPGQHKLFRSADRIKDRLRFFRQQSAFFIRLRPGALETDKVVFPCPARRAAVRKRRSGRGEETDRPLGLKCFGISHFQQDLAVINELESVIAVKTMSSISGIGFDGSAAANELQIIEELHLRGCLPEPSRTWASGFDGDTLR